MNIEKLFLNIAYAADEVTHKGSALSNFMPLILITAVVYFLMIRPQQKKNREHQNKIQNLSRGDEILTAGGIIGTIVSIPTEGNNITIEIAKDIQIQINKMYITEFLGKTEVKKDKPEKKSKKTVTDNKDQSKA